jgi:hypothetical protein
MGSYEVRLIGEHDIPVFFIQAQKAVYQPQRIIFHTGDIFI